MTLVPVVKEGNVLAIERILLELNEKEAVVAKEFPEVYRQFNDYSGEPMVSVRHDDYRKQLDVTLSRDCGWVHARTPEDVGYLKEQAEKVMAAFEGKLGEIQRVAKIITVAERLKFFTQADHPARKRIDEVAKLANDHTNDVAKQLGDRIDAGVEEDPDE